MTKENAINAIKSNNDNILKIINQKKYKEVMSLDFHNNLNDEFKSILSQIDEKTFKIAVIATIKAGKSTFINAILGDEYLPSSNVPETSNFLVIKSTSDDTISLKHENEEINSSSKDILEYLKKMNYQTRSKMLNVKKNIILHIPKDKIFKNDFFNYEFIDTPGPNEASSNFKSDVFKLFSESDVVLFLMDYSKLKSTDEKEVLEAFNKIRPTLLNKVNKRLFFIVNKFDRKNTNSLNESDTIDYVFDLLNKYSIPKEQILLCSAEYALLSKMILNNSFSRIDDFGKYCFGEMWEYEKNKNTKEDLNELCLERAEYLLEKSKINYLEDKIFSFIREKNELIFIDSLESKTLDNLKKTYNLVQTKKCTLNKTESELKDIIENLKKSRSDCEKELKMYDKKIKEFYEDINNMLFSDLDDFNKIVLTIINDEIKMENDIKKISHKNNFDTEKVLDATVDAGIEMLPKYLKSQKKSQATAKRVLKDVCIIVKEGVKGLFKDVNDIENADQKIVEESIFKINSKIEESLNDGFTYLRENLEERFSDKQNDLNDEIHDVLTKINDNFLETINQEFKFDKSLYQLNFTIKNEDILKINSSIEDFLDKRYHTRKKMLYRRTCVD